MDGRLLAATHNENIDYVLQFERSERATHITQIRHKLNYAISKTIFDDRRKIENDYFLAWCHVVPLNT